MGALSPARLLHFLRRRSAVRRLQQTPTPAAVVFICYGNLCRSPFAAGLFEKRLPAPLGSSVRVMSAGFDLPGRPAPQAAIAAAAARGVDLASHRSQSLKNVAAPPPTLLVLMESAHRRWLRRRLAAAAECSTVFLGDLDPLIHSRTVRDPMGQSPEVFDQVYDRIDRCIDELVRHLTRAQ